MKVFIVLAAFVAVASAGYLPAGPLVAPVTTGTSSQFRSEDNYGNYNFGYDESHATGSTSRREEQVNGVRHGSYSLSDADGRQRTVNYVADIDGFRASIHTNEPGVEPKDPAAVLINKEGPVGHAVPLPAPVLAAPAPLPAPILAAPAPLPAPILAAPGPRYAARGDYYPRAPIAVPAPAPVYGPAPIHAPVAVVEPATPRAFTYSFGAEHVAPIAAPAPIAYHAPAPIAHPVPIAGPIYQDRLGY